MRMKSNVSDSFRSNQWDQKEVHNGTHTPTNTVTGYKRSPRTNSQTCSDQHSFLNSAKDQMSDNQVSQNMFMLPEICFFFEIIVLRFLKKLMIEQVSMSVELERLRSELRQVQGMFVVAQTEALDNTRKVCYCFN